MKGGAVSQPKVQKKEYTFEEDTMITAHSAVNIVISTKEGVDPVPFVAALLEGYARRAQTVYNTSTASESPFSSRKRQRQVKSDKQ
jgi:hypothetical protein